MKSLGKRIGLSLVIIIVIVVLGALGTGWYLFSNLEEIVLGQLESKTSGLTKGLYHVKVNKLSIDLLDGHLFLKDVSLYPDTVRLNYLKSVDSIPPNYVEIKIKSVEFSGINFRKKNQLSGRKLLFTSIDIVSPEVVLTRIPGGLVQNRDTAVASKSLYEIIAPTFDVLSASKINIKKGRLEYRVETAGETAVYSMENINFQVDNFQVDSTSQARNRVLYCENIHCNIENVHHFLPGKSYCFNVGKVSLGIKDSSFSVEGIELIPQFPKLEFAYKVPNHSDWMSLKIGKVALKGIRFHDLFFKRSVNIDSIQIRDVRFENFKNQKIIITHKKMTLLYEKVQRIKIPLDIKNIKINNVTVIYEELAKSGKTPGLIRFTDINGELKGLTNIVSFPGQTYSLVAKGKLMNEGLINATVHFPVDSMNDRFEVKGTLGKMNMLPLNQIIEPLAPARIKGGSIQGLDFHIIGGRHRASVDMQLLYNGLALTIFKDNSKDKDTKPIFSMLANSFAKNDNPDKGKEPRRVHSERIRDPYHSSFNYIWKILLSGIIETVGFTDQKQDKVSWIKGEIKKLKGGDKKGEKKRGNSPK